MEIIFDLVNELVELLYDWPAGTVIGALIFLVLSVLVGLVLWGLYVAIDSWFLPRQKSKGKVVAKDFTPAHIDFIYIYSPATKTNLPHPVHHPDRWSITVRVDELQDSTSVNKEFYNSLKEGDTVTAEFVIGRFSRDLYLKDLYHA